MNKKSSMKTEQYQNYMLHLGNPRLQSDCRHFGLNVVPTCFLRASSHSMQYSCQPQGNSMNIHEMIFNLDLVIALISPLLLHLENGPIPDFCWKQWNSFRNVGRENCAVIDSTCWKKVRLFCWENVFMDLMKCSRFSAFIWYKPKLLFSSFTLSFF